MAKTSLNLDENIEAALAYVLSWISGLAIYLLEKENKFVRFHAMQSFITFLGLSIIGVILSFIPVMGEILSRLLGILGIILWIVCIIKAYQGERFKLPSVGDIAEKYV